MSCKNFLLVDEFSDDDDDYILPLPVVASHGSAGKESATPALDRLAAQVREKKQQQRDKVDSFYTQQDVHKAHSRYITNNMTLTSGEASQARYAAAGWAKTNGIKVPHRRRGNRSSSPIGFRGNRSNSTMAAGTSGRVGAVDASSLNGVQATSASSVSVCPVTMCGAKFSRRDLLQRHLAQGVHSPCDPCLHLLDGKIQSRITSHVCPVCQALYKDYTDCQLHMVQNGHDHLMAPLPIAAYMCPQCLDLFPDKASCQIHMDVARHTQYLYGFKDDVGGAEPVPTPRAVVQAYRELCASQPWCVECTHCNYRLDADEMPRLLPNHVDRQHKLVAFTDMSSADVFVEMLRGYTCVQCQRLFQKLPKEGLGSIHQCDNNNVGMIVDSDCKTFCEFILRSGLQPLVDITPDIVAGTGHPGSDEASDLEIARECRHAESPHVSFSPIVIDSSTCLSPGLSTPDHDHSLAGLRRQSVSPGNSPLRQEASCLVLTDNLDSIEKSQPTKKVSPKKRKKKKVPTATLR